MLDQQELDRSLRALADPTRRALLEQLSIRPSNAQELRASFELTLAAIVHHLKVLEESRLIRTEKVGRVRTCRLDPAGLTGLTDWITERRSAVERQLDRLGAVLDDVNPPNPQRKGTT